MQKNYSQIFFILLCLSIVGVLLHFLSPILMPFLAAALIAYLTDPIVEKMTKWRIPRLLSVIIVFLIFFSGTTLIVLLLIPLVQKQIVAFANIIPNMVDWFELVFLPWLETTFGVEPVVNATTLKNTFTQHIGAAGNVVTWFFKTTLASGITLIHWLTNLILIPVVTFYLLRDWKGILRSMRNLLPRNFEPTIVKLIKECDLVLSEFFRGQLLVMLALGVIYSIGLTLIGLKIGLLIGMIAGLVSIVPYLGFIVGIISASLAAYIQFGTVNSLLLVGLVFLIGQLLESMILTPKLVGDRIGLHPVVVIFAILVGGSLFGFFGVLLALPVAAVIMVWLRFFTHRYRHSRLYQE